MVMRMTAKSGGEDSLELDGKGWLYVWIVVIAIVVTVVVANQVMTI